MEAAFWYNLALSFVVGGAWHGGPRWAGA